MGKESNADVPETKDLLGRLSKRMVKLGADAILAPVESKLVQIQIGDGDELDAVLTDGRVVNILADPKARLELRENFVYFSRKLSSGDEAALKAQTLASRMRATKAPFVPGPSTGQIERVLVFGEARVLHYVRRRDGATVKVAGDLEVASEFNALFQPFMKRIDSYVIRKRAAEAAQQEVGASR